MKITFDLSRSDLEHFKQVLSRACESVQGLPAKDIVDNASKLLGKVNAAETSDFIRDQMVKLETLIGMVVDKGWGLEEADKARIINALAYFSNAEDLIPDHIPGLGFLDDAIVIEIVAQELKHEIQAYRDFVVFRAAESCRLGEDAASLDKATWLEERRKQLHSRMRRRRKRSSGRGDGSKSPFSLL